MRREEGDMEGGCAGGEAGAAPYSLNILHVEDDPNAVRLARATLEAGGFRCSVMRVESREAFVAALECGGFDLVLADYSLPRFNGLEALRITRGRAPGLPFILVSGILAEDLAIASLECGAADYVMKTRLARLAPAVRRALAEVEARAARERLEEEIVQSQKTELFGRLARGVAHDFNNILAAIMGHCSLALAKLGSESPLYKYTEEIAHAAERAIELMQQLHVSSPDETVTAAALNPGERKEGAAVEMPSPPMERVRRVLGAATPVNTIAGPPSGACLNTPS